MADTTKDKDTKQVEFHFHREHTIGLTTSESNHQQINLDIHSETYDITPIPFVLALRKDSWGYESEYFKDLIGTEFLRLGNYERLDKKVLDERKLDVSRVKPGLKSLVKTSQKLPVFDRINEYLKTMLEPMILHKIARVKFEKHHEYFVAHHKIYRLWTTMDKNVTRTLAGKIHCEGEIALSRSFMGGYMVYYTVSPRPEIKRPEHHNFNFNYYWPKK